mmetsp:Transcript_8449/g.15979  ORF Transcript_8449/g.15979 Transcript_8449/m.15979 type:complete len:268 (-) Transcript_8449:456-1259(-)
MKVVMGATKPDSPEKSHRQSLKMLLSFIELLTVFTSMYSRSPPVSSWAFSSRDPLEGWEMSTLVSFVPARPLASTAHFASAVPNANSVSRPSSYFTPDEQTPPNSATLVEEPSCLRMVDASKECKREVFPTPRPPTMATLARFHVISPEVISLTTSSASCSQDASKVLISSLLRTKRRYSNASSLGRFLIRSNTISCWSAPLFQTMSMAAIPRRFRRRISAFASSTKNCAERSWLYFMASMRAVVPVLSRSSTSTPYFSTRNLIGSI